MSEERNLLTEGREPMALQLARVERCLGQTVALLRQKAPSGSGKMFDDVFDLLATALKQLSYIREPFDHHVHVPQYMLGFRGTVKGVSVDMRVEGVAYQFDLPFDQAFRLHDMLLESLAEHMSLSGHPNGETMVEFIKLIQRMRGL